MHSKILGGMDFKDLRVFSDALLGKKVWRLVHHEESLMSKVIKAKYYPKCRFLTPLWVMHEVIHGVAYGVSTL